MSSRSLRVVCGFSPAVPAASARWAKVSEVPKLPSWWTRSSRTLGPAWTKGRRASSGSARASADCRARRAAGRSSAATARVVSSSQASTRVCGSSAGVVPASTGRTGRCGRVRGGRPADLGPGAHDQQLGVVVGAFGEPAVDGAGRGGVPEQQRGAELERRRRMRPAAAPVWRSPNSERACCSSASPSARSSVVEDGGAVDGLQREPQGRGQQRGARGERVGGEALGLGGRRRAAARRGRSSWWRRPTRLSSASRVGWPWRAPRCCAPAWCARHRRCRR